MRRWRRADAGWLLRGIGGRFSLLPELVVIGVSFNPTTRMVMSFSSVSSQWYVSLWQHQEFFHGFMLSFALAPCVAACALLFGGAAAYGFCA